MKSLLTFILIVLFFRGSSQELVAENHWIWPKLHENSVRVHELSSHEPALFHIYSIDTTLSVNHFDSGLYYYRVNGFHFDNHPFILSDSTIQFIDLHHGIKKTSKQIENICIQKFENEAECFICLSEFYKAIHEFLSWEAAK